jgi:hypothetical protein
VASFALLVPAGAAAWTWPVQGPVIQPFLFDELTPEAPGQHRGISIGAAVATPVRAPVDATITFAGTVPYGGKTLSLLSRESLSVTLLHLGSFNVTRGMTVVEGQVVGAVGPSTVPELDEPFVYLGVRRVDDPEGYLDPLLFLPQPAVEPPPVEPPPAPDPMPAPVAPPPVAVIPPATLPPAPPAVQPSRPRLARPTEGTPLRPEFPGSAWDAPVTPSTSPSSAPEQSETARTPQLVPTDPLTSPGVSAHGRETAALVSSARALTLPQPSSADRGGAPSWRRPLNQFEAASPAVAASSDSRAGAGRQAIELLGPSLAALALLLLVVRRGRGGGARIIGGHALLPDNADLLREREPAHRARVHDDRRRRARPAPQAAR